MSTAAPPIDPNRPSPARVYDAFLGGTHNFAVDRAIATRTSELLPETALLARANRAFLGRAVRYAAGRGITQFLDLGSGIPTEGNVHEVARAEVPDATVVYVDVDPTAVLYARHLLGDDPLTAVVHSDLREPATVLGDARVRELIDFSRPVAVMMVAVLHFVPDGPALDAAVRAYRDAVVPGSVLAFSHTTFAGDTAVLERITHLYTRTGGPLVPRDAERMARFLDGWRLVEPGLVAAPLWRPDPADEPITGEARNLMLACVAER
ncbi:SAM-dependent methyltransferase [Actinoplanes utahensis]|uniref:S-adenosyl methyltransferase n=1 Tax=Actinoplanes utahensis TaxID=1869 RepID=A0A0A6UC03_ACTUT|nr:SAM-dependent methyltransferase [Actinoplanes utahensis]KHD73021.1 hypothetical protein MB27_37225 [Actinoplanes utahensis]GIF35119.1 hypothetical protein Aut01nite_81050 [Actinoplanes utahensis]